jgi:hypothetical protein
MASLPKPPSKPQETSEPTLHALVDAAQDPAIYPRLRRAGRDAVILPLFDGQTARELATVAPYLVRLDPDSPLAQWLIETPRDRACALYVWSTVSTEALRAHFRRLTKVRTERGGTVFFRFYDPRVLRALLQTCDGGQLGEIFGPVEMFVIETDAGSFETLTLAGERLQIGPGAKERVEC